MRILLFLAVATPLIAFWPTGQDPATTTDWAKEVERACTTPRLGLRIAASRKVAAAGDAAVPAIRAFVQQRGQDQLPVTLAEAMADDPANGPLTLQLLRDWSNDRAFYWRASAMRGLALRGPKLEKAQQDELRPLFASFHDDAAWLMRAHARLGTVLLGDAAAYALPEPDPRAKARLHTQVLLRGLVPPLQPMLDALADQRTCLGIPWGQNTAAEVHKALKNWLGDAHPLANGGESFPDVATGLQAMRDALAKKSGQTLTVPAVRTDTVTGVVGGFEFLSCKLGDQFVQWTNDGTLWFGIDASARVQLPGPIWDTLTKERAALPLAGNLGVVVCDSLRAKWPEPAVDVRVAPAALPVPAADWLKRLAAAIEEAGEPRLAAQLRTGLEQFAAR